MYIRYTTTAGEYARVCVRVRAPRRFFISLGVHATTAPPPLRKIGDGILFFARMSISQCVQRERIMFFHALICTVTIVHHAVYRPPSPCCRCAYNIQFSFESAMMYRARKDFVSIPTMYLYLLRRRARVAETIYTENIRLRMTEAH